VGEKWGLLLRGDAGGGGSKLVWSVILGADWRFKQWGSVRCGYRWLDYDFDKDSDGNSFRFDFLAQGPFFAAVLHW
jgi:hypothetical protein